MKRFKRLPNSLKKRFSTFKNLSMNLLGNQFNPLAANFLMTNFITASSPTVSQSAAGLLDMTKCFMNSACLYDCCDSQTENSNAHHAIDLRQNRAQNASTKLNDRDAASSCSWSICKELSTLSCMFAPI